MSCKGNNYREHIRYLYVKYYVIAEFKSILIPSIIVHHYLITTTLKYVMYILYIISLLLVQLITTSANEYCGLCLPTGPPYEDTYLVTRLWSIQSSSWSDLDVIEEFNKGFAPIVTNMPGFIQYTAAVNDYNSSTVYFSNVFSSQDLAHNAQLAAQEFVTAGALKDVIVRIILQRVKLHLILQPTNV